MVKRPSRQQIKKRVFGRCFFCGETNYEVLDVHRIFPGSEGGRYTEFNSLTTCCKCHRLIHSGEIVVDRKYKTSRGVSIVHYTRNGVDSWEYEERA